MRFISSTSLKQGSTSLKQGYLSSPSPFCYKLGNRGALLHHGYILPLSLSHAFAAKSGYSFLRNQRTVLQSTQQYTQSITESTDVIDIHETKSITLAHDIDFIKSPLDRRQYKCIQLPNKLQVLLVSDPDTDIEAASMHIKAGHFDDPIDRPGLGK